MRIAILADIHSNIIAFEAVLTDVRRRGGFDRIWALGDMVGYGPCPNECLDLLRSLDHVAIAGNHDSAAVGRTPLTLFNRDAAVCCRWNGLQLSESNRDYLSGLPEMVQTGEFTLVHGSLRDPIWEYLVHEEAARSSFRRLRTRYLVVGHSHLPILFEEVEQRKAVMQAFAEGKPLCLGETRLIFNPGAVGQPRDGDPRAAYAIYDTDTGQVHHYRVEYDIAGVQREMLKQELPQRMAQRLSGGW